MKFSSQVAVAVSFLITTAVISISGSPMNVEVQNDPYGLNSEDIQYVVGGDPSENGQFPYYVLMRDNTRFGFCGGSLIAPRVVLTAAHCQPENNIGNFLTVGPTDRNNLGNGSSQRAENIKSEDAIPHPDYNSNSESNDFALVLLEEEYILDSNGVQLVLNDASSFPAAGDILDVLGMGTLSSQGDLADVLMDVQVEAFSNAQCNNYFSGDPIEDNMLCAGFEEGGKDSCQGDSGGPLVKIVGNTHTQVGVVSWGYGCADRNSPGVYSRVSEQIGWMRNQICNEWGVESSLCGPTTPPAPTDTQAPVEAPVNPPTWWSEPPVEAPVSPPVELFCDAGSSDIEIVFNFDGYAEEISWSITDTNSNGYVDGSAYDYNANNNEVVEAVTLCHSGCYEFEFNDFAGDGMCDTDGCGSFEIMIQDDVVLRGGDFDILSVHTFSFCLDDNGTVQPQAGDDTTGAGSSVVGVEIDFFSDYNYTYEISWTITDTTSNIEFGGDIYGEGFNYDADELGGRLIIESVPLWNDKCYEFVIQDSAGDGLCDSELGCGTYGIIVNEEYVYFEAGDFGYSATLSLCLDGSGNVVEAVPEVPECTDDTEFRWKNKGKRDCEWVANRLEKKPNLCKKKGKFRGESGKIRGYCQLTCEQC